MERVWPTARVACLRCPIPKQHAKSNIGALKCNIDILHFNALILLIIHNLRINCQLYAQKMRDSLRHITISARLQDHNTAWLQF